MNVRTCGRSAVYPMLLALVVAVAHPLTAQSHYPSLQTPRITEREFNFVGADGDQFSTLLFQWREGMGPKTQLSMDVGVAHYAGGNSNASFLLGGQYARDVRRASPELPLDMLFTVGVFTGLGSGRTVFGIPFGLSAGHRFPLEGGMAITPFAHPRLAFNRCSSCRLDGRGDTDLTPTLDLGASFEFNPNLAARAAIMLGATDTRFGFSDVFGFSVAWTPTPLQRPAR